jgi:23S rRNA (cytidine1920-2'-O)/16S rRNA (cytidine1409-2'-O)-methyltransferase
MSKPGKSTQKVIKLRLDWLLVDRGLVDSRERGQALILAGQVMVNAQKVQKAGAIVPGDAEVRILGERMPYVSRGGLKLEGALRTFGIDVAGMTALDVGASTGGFTDCLLQHGCRKVFAVDVGYGQMAWKVRQDPRVVVIERVNIREMAASLVPEPVDVAVIDVSFISLEKVVPAVLPFLKAGARMVALIKPQFEVGKGQVGKGGIVRDEVTRMAAVEKIRAAFNGAGLDIQGIMPSPITGQDGNVEYLLYAVMRPANSSPNTTMDSMSR